MSLRTTHEARACRRKDLKILVFSFVLLGMIVVDFLSLVSRADLRIIQGASKEYDYAVYGMIPRNTSRYNCSKNATTKQNATSESIELLQDSLDVSPFHIPASSLNDTIWTKASQPVVSVLKSYVTSIQDFDPQVPVAIVTKIHGRESFGSLNQSLCLLTQAYNNRVHYDIIIFSTITIGPVQLDAYQATIAPAKLLFVVDNPGLKEMVDELDNDHKQQLLRRCNATDSSHLTWTTHCLERSSSGTSYLPIKYSWQAEFRSLHLWKHPSLAKYRYMIWMDSDAFCTKVWQQDPIAILRRHSLILLFDNFPMGRATGSEWVGRTKLAFGKSICTISMKNGTLHANKESCKYARLLRQVHGFFHVTDLDFYRSDPVMNWQRIMIGDSKFSRMYDDQMAVTMPAAVLAGNRSWNMRHFGFNLSVVHNFKMDGRKSEKVGPFKTFWQRQGRQRFPEAYGKCDIVSVG